MSATTQDDSFFVKTLGISINAISVLDIQDSFDRIFVEHMVTLSFTIFSRQKNLNRAHMLFQVLRGFEPVFYTTHPNEEPKKSIIYDLTVIAEKYKSGVAKMAVILYTCTCVKR